ncbi:TetR family transcriptional regulator [Nocardiopsis sp. CNR-923]|uniref:TetR/AcrR family transcriptional regulator n=1 Tax=Nocardiopsis sp. CNR-923 TaxID=1904965 RepID=UPI00095F94F8|nr:TetR/AcrR family transcriptional regulator [Nocardiopsis sp. CNR-923]OLT30383.1 TetR family transcriptional regulator [Nocardiopsis sp. CNR-923]
MARITRAEQQARNRSRVLAAAGDEFAERGFRDAKVDRIAERAELTRGAVYSNFPSKRALYLSVLAEAAERAVDERLAVGPASPPPAAGTPRAVLGAFARALLAGPSPGAPPGWADPLPESLDDAPLRQAFTQLLRLESVLLGLSLETLAGPGTGRRVRVAQTALTTLYGAVRLAGAAPGFVDPFGVIGACANLADLDVADAWPLPYLEHVPAAEPADAPWSPPGAFDALRREPADLTGDGVVVVLGLHRLEAVEEAVRSAPGGADVTAVVVTGDRGERMPLARSVLARLCAALRESVPEHAWPPPRLVLDDGGAVAAAAGVIGVDDATEAAVRIRGGRITARAAGRGAGHAVAAVTVASPL